MKKYGLFIGIDHYHDPNITQLRCAAHDARALARVFEQKYGFDVKVLSHEEFSPGHGIGGILRGIGDELEEGDIFVFFFAGHGKTIEKNGKSDQLFLLPNASSLSLEGGNLANEGMLSYRKLCAETAAWRGVRRVFILDACRSPLRVDETTTLGGGIGPAHFEGEVVYRDVEFARSAKQGETSFVLFNSCQDQQRAEELESYQGGHGLFTASLLDTLADYERLLQAVAVDDRLTEAVAQRMRLLARKHGNRGTSQRPFRSGASVSLFSREELQVRHLGQLRANFDLQLKEARLDSPPRDNCQETLHLYCYGDFSGEHLENRHAMDMRLQAALAEREKKRKQELEAEITYWARIDRHNMQDLTRYLEAFPYGAHIHNVQKLLADHQANRKKRGRLGIAAGAMAFIVLLIVIHAPNPAKFQAISTPSTARRLIDAPPNPVAQSPTLAAALSSAPFSVPSSAPVAAPTPIPKPQEPKNEQPAVALPSASASAPLMVAQTAQADLSVVLSDREKSLEQRQSAWHSLRLAQDQRSKEIVAVFVKQYKEDREQVLASPWWKHPKGNPGNLAHRWLQDGAVLAASNEVPEALEDQVDAFEKNLNPKKDPLEVSLNYIRLVEAMKGQGLAKRLSQRERYLSDAARWLVDALRSDNAAYQYDWKSVLLGFEAAESRLGYPFAHFSGLIFELGIKDDKAAIVAYTRLIESANGKKDELIEEARQHLARLAPAHRKGKRK